MPIPGDCGILPPSGLSGLTAVRQAGAGHALEKGNGENDDDYGDDDDAVDNNYDDDDDDDDDDALEKVASRNYHRSLQCTTLRCIS